MPLQRRLCFQWSLILLAILLIQPLARGASAQVKKLAKITGIPVERLSAIKAERFFSRDVFQRREFMRDLALNPSVDLLPLVVLIGTKEVDDEPIRRSAIRLYGHFGLLCDRKEIKGQIFPAIRTALSFGAKRGQDQRWAFEELARLSKWFELDADLYELLLPAFQGEDFNLRGLAFKSLCEIRHEVIAKDFLIPACLKVYGSTQGYSLFDRYLAVDELADRAIDRIGPLLRDALAAGQDPKMQIRAFKVFARWKDPSTLPLALKIDGTAVHELRQAAFANRVALSDRTTLSDFMSWLGKDHINVLSYALERIGELPGDEAPKILERALSGKLYPAERVDHWQRRGEAETIENEQESLWQAAAIALLRRGDSSGVEKLKSFIAGDIAGKSEGARIALARRVLAVENPAANTLIPVMLSLRGDPFRGLLESAAIAAGERKLQDAGKDLLALYADPAYEGAIKFQAGVSLVELEKPMAWEVLKTWLPNYKDDETQVDGNRFVLGTLQFELSRWSGSGYLKALAKFDRTRDKKMLPLILGLLQERAPPAGAAPPSKDKKPAPKSGSTTRTRPGKDEKALDDGQPTGPEPSYLAKNQFVRARAVLIAARIAGAEAKDVLAKAIDDHRSVVRSAAVRAIGEITGRYSLPVGATLAEESKVRPDALAWLVELGARKAE